MSSDSFPREQGYCAGSSDARPAVKLDGDAMKLRGRDGREIPMPPDMIRSWQEQLRGHAGNSLAIAAAVYVANLVRDGGRYLAVFEVGWAAAAQQLAIAAAEAVVMGALAAGYLALLDAAFSRRTGKRIGRILERDVAGLTAGELAQEIAVVRDGLARAPNARLRVAHANWLAWLEAQAAARPVEALDRPLEWVLRPTPVVQIMKLCVGGSLLVLSVWVGVDSIREHEISGFTTALAVGLAGAGVWLLASMWTFCIQLTPERLELRAFWRTRWAVARDRAELRAGVVRDGSAPGYGAFDTQTGKQVGQLVATLFRAADLQKLAALFPPPR